MTAASSPAPPAGITATPDKSRLIMITDISAGNPTLGRAWSRLFFWTGVITMLPGLQFVLPVQMLQLQGLDVTDPAGMFYARDWALMALCFGALLVHASRSAAGRGTVILAAAVEKLGLALLVALAWNEPGLKGLHGAAVFDGLCAALYLTWLSRQRGKP
jgi:hypothetical protein